MKAKELLLLWRILFFYLRARGRYIILIYVDAISLYSVLSILLSYLHTIAMQWLFPDSVDVPLICMMRARLLLDTLSPKYTFTLSLRVNHWRSFCHLYVAKVEFSFVPTKQGLAATRSKGKESTPASIDIPFFLFLLSPCGQKDRVYALKSFLFTPYSRERPAL